jgi:hypothetical protein
LSELFRAFKKIVLLFTKRKEIHLHYLYASRCATKIPYRFR